MVFYRCTNMVLVLRVAVLLSVLSASCACSCVPTHPQGHFCRAQFVIRGKILSGPVKEFPENLLSGSGIPVKFLAYQVYTVRITKIYKGSAAIRETGGLRVYGSRRRSYSIKIYTPSKMNSCKVDFTDGKVYVISGYIGRKKLSISGCDFRKEWSQITKKQRSGFARKFHRSCECRYDLCYGTRDCNKKKLYPMSCGYDITNNPANECRDKYLYCQLNNDQKSCSWTTNRLYRDCIKQIP